MAWGMDNLAQAIRMVRPLFHIPAKFLSPGAFISSSSDLHTTSYLDTGSGANGWRDLVQKQIRVAKVTAGQMNEAGFINVTVREFKLPIDPWHTGENGCRRAGMFALVDLLEVIHDLSVKIFTDLLGWSMAELELHIVDAVQDGDEEEISAQLLPPCEYIAWVVWERSAT